MAFPKAAKNALRIPPTPVKSYLCFRIVPKLDRRSKLNQAKKIGADHANLAKLGGIEELIGIQQNQPRMVLAPSGPIGIDCN